MAIALDGPPYTASSPEVAREDRTNTCDDGLAAFMSLRPRLFGIAYRMLGRAAEAEDVVQDVWVRWQAADRSVVRDAAAFLATTTTRLAINVMQSARARRERLAEPWRQEPVDTTANPQMGTESHEGLKAGLLLLLETLTPRERAAYILREAFDYTYRDIANALRLEEANARQVVTRARQRVANGCRIPATSTDHRRLLEAFVAAASTGDVVSLEDILCDGCRDRSKQQHASIARMAPIDALHARGQRAAA